MVKKKNKKIKSLLQNSVSFAEALAVSRLKATKRAFLSSRNCKTEVLQFPLKIKKKAFLLLKAFLRDYKRYLCCWISFLISLLLPIHSLVFVSILVISALTK